MALVFCCCCRMLRAWSSKSESPALSSFAAFLRGNALAAFARSAAVHITRIMTVSDALLGSRESKNRSVRTSFALHLFEL